MKRILILGGNQFVGRSVAEALVSGGYEVYLLNRGSRPNPKGTIHLKGNRNNSQELEEVLKDHYFQGVVDISAYEAHQIEKSLEVLRGRYGKYILISSASIYQDDTSLPYRESSPTGANPIWGEYAENKFQCEEALQRLSHEYAAPFTIFRPFYIYGPGNNLDRETYFINRILDDKPVFIPRRKTRIHFGYIKDLAANIITALEESSFNNEIFNVAGRETATFEEFIGTVEKILGKKANVIKVDETSHGIKARDWFPFRAVDLYGNTSKLLHAGGKTEYSLERGIEETYEYLKDNSLLGEYQLNPLETGLLKRVYLK